MTAEQLRAKYLNIEGLHPRCDGTYQRWAYPKHRHEWRIHQVVVVLECTHEAGDFEKRRYKIVANESDQDTLVASWGLPQNMTLAEALTLLRLHENDL